MRPRYATRRLVATIAISVVLAGCATLPPPTAELAEAQAAVVRAGEADASQLAVPLLEAARVQLVQAQDAMARGRHEQARALALAAAADADLARAQAGLEQARAELAQLQRDAAALHSQLQLPVDAAPAVSVWDSAVAAVGDDPNDPARRLAALEADPLLGSHGGLERLQARQAVDAQAAARGREARAAAAHVAERRVTIAELAARRGAALARADRVRAAIAELRLEASRREAERMRVELERARLQEQVRAEELARLREQAEAEARERQQTQAVLEGVQATQNERLTSAREREVALARQEAELVAGGPLPSSRPVAGGEAFVIAGEGFASGSAILRAPQARQLKAIAAYAQALSVARVRVVGHTDSQGDAQANRALSQRRAQAVRQALIEGGLAAGQVLAEGRGAAEPIADNATAEGRARNRRVQIVLEK